MQRTVALKNQFIMGELANRLRQKVKDLNDFKSSREGVKPPRKNKVRIILHTVVAFVLFAGINYWLVINNATKRSSHAALFVLVPWVVVFGYLGLAYWLTKKKK